MKIYIAGPMTGYKDFNYPAFMEAEQALLCAGFEVENPARNPDPDPLCWEGFMRMAIRQISKCDAVCVLPKWWESKGAMVETCLATVLKMEIVPLHELLARGAK